MNPLRPLLALAALAALLVMTGASCNDRPDRGEPCPKPGAIHVRSDDGGTKRLVCTRDGVWQ